MAIRQINSDADPETTTVDGSGRVTASTTDWATLRSTAAGDHQDATSADTGSVGFNVADTASTTGGGAAGWKSINRGIFLFDIPGNLTGITAATLKLYAIDTDTSLGDLDIALVEHSGPASNTDLVNSDFDLGNFVTGTLLASVKATSSFTTSAYNEMDLNATGLTKIVPGQITNLGIMLDNDRTNSAPGSNADNQHSGILCTYAEGSNPPILEITHAPVGSSLLKMLMSWGGVFALGAELLTPLLAKTISIEAHKVVQ